MAASRLQPQQDWVVGYRRHATPPSSCGRCSGSARLCRRLPRTAAPPDGACPAASPDGKGGGGVEVRDCPSSSTLPLRRPQPRCPGTKVIAQHIQQRHSAEHRAEQVGPLPLPHQQPAIAPPSIVSRCELVLNLPVIRYSAALMKSSEDVLLALPTSRDASPRKLTTAAQVSPPRYTSASIAQPGHDRAGER